MIGVWGRRSRRSEPRLAVWIVLAVVLMAAGCTHAGAGLTPEVYASSVGGDARIVPEGQLVLDGNRVICGRRVTVLNSNFVAGASRKICRVGTAMSPGDSAAVAI